MSRPLPAAGNATLAPGMRAVFAKTISDADILRFAEASGDANPVHLDERFASGTAFGGRIAHGLLSASVISAALAAKLPGPGTVYLAQDLRFRAPVRPGATVAAEVVVLAVDEKRRRVRLSTVCRVDGRVVVDGEATVLAPPGMALVGPAAPPHVA